MSVSHREETRTIYDVDLSTTKLYQKLVDLSTGLDKFYRVGKQREKRDFYDVFPENILTKSEKEGRMGKNQGDSRDKGGAFCGNKVL